jgi:hypothetical protein
MGSLRRHHLFLELDRRRQSLSQRLLPEGLLCCALSQTVGWCIIRSWAPRVAKCNSGYNTTDIPINEIARRIDYVTNCLPYLMSVRIDEAQGVVIGILILVKRLRISQLGIKCWVIGRALLKLKQFVGTTRKLIGASEPALR